MYIVYTKVYSYLEHLLYVYLYSMYIYYIYRSYFS